ncbi:hypothetical protein [Pseudonocardia phyllosphaerae]|uniref:hypothetical protein n=1 Tax=Pseudonocardia phyllosphaerae TaxID=3390502 RepID=UPI00397C481D
MTFPDDPAAVPVATAPLGDRFVARRGRPTGFTPADLVFGAGLDDAIARVQRERGARTRAVAAILLLDRYALRLTPPVLAAFTQLDVLLDARPAAVSLGPDERVPGWVAFAADGVPAHGDRAALRRSLLTEGLLPVADALAARTRASPRLLRGAVAHAVALSYLHLSWPCPDHDRHTGAARELLCAAELDELVAVDDVVVDGRAWTSVERRTCCLAFRCTGAHGWCGTCPCRPAADIAADVAAACRSYAARHP